VLDHNAHPVAGIAVTYPEEDAAAVARLADDVRRAAATLTTRLGGPA
jgi:DNA-binding IclR family transcriptional regulator